MLKSNILKKSISNAHGYTMAPKYPAPMNVRFTGEDMKQLDQLSQKLDMPRSALIRRLGASGSKQREKPPANFTKATNGY